MKQKFSIAMSLAVIMAMLFTSVGLASDVAVAVVDVSVPTNSVTLAPGESGLITIRMTVTGKQEGTATFEVYTKWTLSGGTFAGSEPVQFTVNPRAAQDAATVINTSGTVKVASGQTPGGPFQLTVSTFDITNSNSTGAKLADGADGIYSVAVSAPPPPANTAPTVAITGVTNGASYSKGTVPQATCSVTDAEDGNSSFAATLSGITGPYASDGIGSQTASCSYTDAGGLTAPPASVTYSIVDPTAPSISYTLTPDAADGNNGWYTSNVTVDWTISDPDSSFTTLGCMDTTISADTAETTLNCSATSAGGTNSDSVTIKRDGTAPVITFVSPDASAWYANDVTANWSCSDALSGPVSTSVGALASGEGSDIPATGNCADNAGNTAIDTQYFKIDKTGPGIVANATKADNSGYTADTWTNQDVAVDFVCSDDGSGVASCLGDATYNTDGIFTATGTATDNVGNSSNANFGPIKIDKTAPTITGEPTTVPNANGWYNGDVTIHWTCSDALSGLSGSCPADSVITDEGQNLSVSVSVSDMAGNTANATVSGINIDKTAPTASASASPDANTNGWNNTNVTVSFNGLDTLSGIASCSNAVVLSSEGANQSTSGTCTDKAGNVSAPATASGINIDKTAPVASASASPAPNANGWNNTDVTISFSGTDELSGVAACDAAVVLSSEGANQSASGTCTDRAGNVSTPASASASIDKTAPIVALVGGPANDGVYYFGFVPAAPTCSASDALSGLDGSCNVSGYSNAIGDHTALATATDKAGNSATASASYTVKSWTLNGFYQPVDMNGVLNTVKNGSTVPLKFELFAGPTELTNTSYVSSLQAYQVSCTAGGTEDAIETVSTGATSLRYDATAGQFIFNWQTPKKPGTCYKVVMTALDGSTLSANFKLK